MFFRVSRDRLSPESVQKLLGLAQVLYSTGQWLYDNSFYLQPDTLGAVARAEFFAQARAEFAQLADAGREISGPYQAYILESVFDAVKWSEVKMSVQNLPFFCALGNTSSTQYARQSTFNFVQSTLGSVGEQNPPFYLTRDPLELLLEDSLAEDVLPGRYNSLDLMIRLLEGGYNLSKRRVILLNTSAHLSDIFQCDAGNYTKFLPGGTLFLELFLEVNTSFLLTLFVRLLASQQSLFPYIVDFSALFKRLKTAVGGLNTPAFSRVRAFLPEHIRADGRHPEIRPAEKDSQVVHGGDGDSETEQSDEEDLSSEEDYDSDFLDSNDSERRAWASSTEALIPRTEDDSNTVLAALSGDIFTFITLSTYGDVIGKLNIPDLEARLREILQNARRSTVQELEGDLIDNGFLVPWSRGPDVWPPSVYSDDPTYDEVEA
jgi:hypothetical protein